MRLIDADTLLDRAICTRNYFEIKSLVERMQTVAPPPNDPLTLEELREVDMDLVRVVRCKDCKHLYFKDFLTFCPHKVSACMPEGFCEYGERCKPEED